MDLSHSEPCKPRVLVADDERVIADTLVIILNQNGFEARAEYDGFAAVHTAEEWQPDVFLSDVIMPGISGFEAAIRIGSMFSECRIVLFSGQANSVDLARIYGLMEHPYQIFPKPIPPQELIRILRDGAAGTIMAS